MRKNSFVQPISFEYSSRLGGTHRQVGRQNSPLDNYEATVGGVVVRLSEDNLHQIDSGSIRVLSSSKARVSPEGFYGQDVNPICVFAASVLRLDESATRKYLTQLANTVKGYTTYLDVLVAADQARLASQTMRRIAVKDKAVYNASYAGGTIQAVIHASAGIPPNQPQQPVSRCGNVHYAMRVGDQSNYSDSVARIGIISTTDEISVDSAHLVLLAAYLFRLQHPSVKLGMRSFGNFNDDGPGLRTDLAFIENIFDSICVKGFTDMYGAVYDGPMCNIVGRQLQPGFTFYSDHTNQALLDSGIQYFTASAEKPSAIYSKYNTGPGSGFVDGSPNWWDSIANFQYVPRLSNAINVNDGVLKWIRPEDLCPLRQQGDTDNPLVITGSLYAGKFPAPISGTFNIPTLEVQPFFDYIGADSIIIPSDDLDELGSLLNRAELDISYGTARTVRQTDGKDVVLCDLRVAISQQPVLQHELPVGIPRDFLSPLVEYAGDGWGMSLVLSSIDSYLDHLRDSDSARKLGALLANQDDNAAGFLARAKRLSDLQNHTLQSLLAMIDLRLLKDDDDSPLQRTIVQRAWSSSDWPSQILDDANSGVEGGILDLDVVKAPPAQITSIGKYRQWFHLQLSKPSLTWRSSVTLRLDCGRDFLWFKFGVGIPGSGQPQVMIWWDSARDPGDYGQWYILQDDSVLPNGDIIFELWADENELHVNFATTIQRLRDKQYAYQFVIPTAPNASDVTVSPVSLYVYDIDTSMESATLRSGCFGYEGFDTLITLPTAEFLIDAESLIDDVLQGGPLASLIDDVLSSASFDESWLSLSESAQEHALRSTVLASISSAISEVRSITDYSQLSDAFSREVARLRQRSSQLVDRSAITLRAITDGDVSLIVGQSALEDAAIYDEASEVLSFLGPQVQAAVTSGLDVNTAVAAVVSNTPLGTGNVAYATGIALPEWQDVLQSFMSGYFWSFRASLQVAQFVTKLAYKVTQQAALLVLTLSEKVSSITSNLVGDGQSVLYDALGDYSCLTTPMYSTIVTSSQMSTSTLLQHAGQTLSVVTKPIAVDGVSGKLDIQLLIEFQNVDESHWVCNVYPLLPSDYVGVDDEVWDDRAAEVLACSLQAIKQFMIECIGMYDDGAVIRSVAINPDLTANISKAKQFIRDIRARQSSVVLRNISLLGPIGAMAGAAVGGLLCLTGIGAIAGVSIIAIGAVAGAAAGSVATGIAVSPAGASWRDGIWRNYVNANINAAQIADWASVVDQDSTGVWLNYATTAGGTVVSLGTALTDLLAPVLFKALRVNRIVDARNRAKFDAIEADDVSLLTDTPPTKTYSLLTQKEYAYRLVKGSVGIVALVAATVGSALLIRRFVLSRRMKSILSRGVRNDVERTFVDKHARLARKLWFPRQNTAAVSVDLGPTEGFSRVESIYKILAVEDDYKRRE